VLVFRRLTSGLVVGDALALLLKPVPERVFRLHDVDAEEADEEAEAPDQPGEEKKERWQPDREQAPVDHACCQHDPGEKP